MKDIKIPEGATDYHKTATGSLEFYLMKPSGKWFFHTKNEGWIEIGLAPQVPLSSTKELETINTIPNGATHYEEIPGGGFEFYKFDPKGNLFFKTDRKGWLEVPFPEELKLTPTAEFPTKKPETLTHDGMVYEIGKYYLFNDNLADKGLFARLKGINQNKELPFCADRTASTNYKYATEIKDFEPDFGTITEAPKPLIDGALYMFNRPRTLCAFIGNYSSDNDELKSLPHGYLTKVSDALNIVRLIPETELEDK